jgi:hypothetical protein
MHRLAHQVKKIFGSPRFPRLGYPFTTLLSALFIHHTPEETFSGKCKRGGTFVNGRSEENQRGRKIYAVECENQRWHTLPEPLSTHSLCHKVINMIPVTDDVLKEITEKIVGAVHPKMIILFGSHARGTAGPDSDLDLIVEEDGPFGPERSRRAEMVKL